MSRKTFDVQGGQAYNAPAVEIVEIEVEQPVFQGSGTAPAYLWEDSLNNDLEWGSNNQFE